jgi:hypothetical protein
MADGDHGLVAELARRIEAEAAMVASLVALEQHPGYVLLAGTTPTGGTAERWDHAQKDLERLWADFAIYQQVLEQARRVLDRGVRPGRPDPPELRRLLRERSVEVGRTVVAQRLDGPVEHIETVTLAELTDRMEAAFARVHDLVTTCADRRSAALATLTPLAERLQEARRLAEIDEGPAARVSDLTTRLHELDHTATTDPLALAEDAVAAALAAIGAEVDVVTRELAELAALRDAWDERLAELRTAVEAAEALQEAERQARLRAQDRIAGPAPPAPPDRLPVLRRRLSALADASGWAERAASLVDLRAQVETATAELRAAHDRAAGLLDRREELRGRFEAYRAKAARLGLAEHPDVLALDTQIRGLLWTRPADLAAATRALVAYQRLLAASGQGRSA